LRQRAITNYLKNKEQQMRRLVQANTDRHPNHEIQSWMDHFVHTMGLSRATHLLFGVGNIDTSTAATCLWHSIETGWKLMEAHENKVWNRYERVGFFRLDSIYTHPINVMSSALAVIPPNFNLKQKILKRRNTMKFPQVIYSMCRCHLWLATVLCS
jgi:hypothetical protein